MAMKEERFLKGKRSYPQYTIERSFLLHIHPGILVTVAFVVFKPLLDSIGYPPLLAFLLAILLTDIPFMLGMMLNEGKKLNGLHVFANALLRVSLLLGVLAM